MKPPPGAESHLIPCKSVNILCLRSSNCAVPVSGLDNRNTTLHLAQGPEMLLGFFKVGFVPAWEPDLAGGGLPRGSSAAASSNATHRAWLGLKQGQQGWEEVLTPDHLPDTKEMCSCPPCRQKCFSYAEAVMALGPGPFPMVPGHPFHGNC